MKLTKENILDMHPCAEGLTFADQCDFDAVKIWNTCPRGDWMIWLLRKTQSIDRQTSVKLACLWAEHVLSIYESKYPDDKRPRLAIEAAKAWADNPTDEKLALVKLAADEAWKARRSAYAATAADDAAADAADAAAVDAVDAAAAAAAAAAYAAYAAAAADAAYAACAAADAAAAYTAYTAELKWQVDKIRELIPCPFENL
jgi:hypothetical protein